MIIPRPGLADCLHIIRSVLPQELNEESPADANAHSSYLYKNLGSGISVSCSWPPRPYAPGIP